MAPAAAWLPALISGGAAVGGAAISAHGQSTAADKQAEAIQKGIDLQEKMYTQDRADFAPYRGLGAGAVGNLAYLGGINLPPPETPPSATPNTQPMTLASLGQPKLGPLQTKAFNTVAGQVNQAEQAYQGPKVKVEYLGQVREIPAILLPRALQQGGKQVS